MDVSLCTSSYPKARPEQGVLVRTSVGHPRFFRYPLVIARTVAPTGSLRDIADRETFTPLYFAKLDANRDAVFAETRRIAGEHPGERLVLLCFEDITRPGVWCHRPVFAEWWKRETGGDAPEL